MNTKNNKGVSLVEVLIYTGLIAVTSTLVGGILVSVLKIQGQQGATTEVNQQLNFVMQNIQRFTRDSSLIELDSGVATSTLILRMEDSVDDPTLIYRSGDFIYLKQGSENPQALTNDRVKADGLEFYKTSSYPGHDSLQVNLTISYNTEVTAESFSKNLTSAIARVNAATFDSDLVPGTSNSYDIGLSGTEWRHLNLSGDLTLSGLLNLGTMSADPSGVNGSIYYNTTDNKFKGYKNGVWQEIGGGQWTLTGNDIYNSNSGNVGIGLISPINKLDVEGSVAIGATYAGTNTAPSNGLIIEGNVGIGTNNPGSKLDVQGGGLTVNGGTSGVINLTAGSPDSTAVGLGINLTGGNGYNRGGGEITLRSGNSSTCFNSISNLNLYGGGADGGGYSSIIVGGAKPLGSCGANYNGADITLTPGTKSGTGSTDGKIIFNGPKAIAAGHWCADNSIENGIGDWTWQSPQINTDTSYMINGADNRSIKILKAGYYYVQANVLQDGLSDNERGDVQLRINSVGKSNSLGYGQSQSYYKHHVSSIIYLNINDEVEVYNASSGAARYGGCDWSTLDIYKLD